MTDAAPIRPVWQHVLDGTATALLQHEDRAAVDRVVEALQRRLAGQLPQASAGFAMHMSKPPHGVAWLAQALASALQPNNHNRDAGAACTELELEAIAVLGRLVGWPQACGHLCSGGTLANLEALWVAKEQLGPQATVLLTDQAHYAHRRNARLLGLRCEVLPCDAAGRWDIAALDARLAALDTAIIVATLGTTALGAVDPLHQLVARKGPHRRVIADAAYGGYHTLVLGDADAARLAFDALPAADAIVIDPHKHGLQPLGCAAVLYPDDTVHETFRHEAPYAYFADPGERALGHLGLEGSRSGAAAAALWATLQLLPPVAGGRFAHDLLEGVITARQWHQRLRSDARAQPTLAPPELDIVVWRPVGVSVDRLRRAAAERGLYLGEVRLPARCFGLAPEQGEVPALRAVWMKPLSPVEREECWAQWVQAFDACV